VGGDSSSLVTATAYRQCFRLRVVESPSVLFLVTVLTMVICNPLVGLLFVIPFLGFLSVMKVMFQKKKKKN
jgi:hypothetical protein